MYIAVIGALAIGVSLGLMGSGGSILTVPVLVYLVGQDEKTAIAGSLLVVGSISAVGGLQYVFRRMVHWPSVLLFGVPGMVGTYGGAAVSEHVAGEIQLLVFELVMLAAAVFMFRPPKDRPAGAPGQKAWKIVLDGLAVGALTGFVGVGGGFLIVPALVLLGGLQMSLAVGTSLLIIALKSFSGFYKYLDIMREADVQLDWHVLGLFIGVGIAGSVVGNQVSRRIPQRALRLAFAGLLVVMGLGMLVKSGIDWLGAEPAAAPSTAASSSD